MPGILAAAFRRFWLTSSVALSPGSGAALARVGCNDNAQPAPSCAPRTRKSRRPAALATPTMDVTRMRPLCWRQETVCGSWKAPDGSAAQTRVDARRLHFILLTILRWGLFNFAKPLCTLRETCEGGKRG